MKKIGVLLIFMLLFLAPIALGLETGGIEESIDEKAGEIEGQIADIEQLTKEDIKWDYLSQEIQKIMLKNKFVAFADKIFKKMDFLFVALFGQHYSISLILLVSIILFGYLFASFRKILKDYSMFSEGISDAVAFLLCIILAQLGLYLKASEFIFKFIFYDEGWFAWARTAIIIAILIGINYALRWGGEIQKKRRKETEKFKTELAQKTIQMTAKAIEPINRALGRNNK